VSRSRMVSLIRMSGALATLGLTLGCGRSADRAATDSATTDTVAHTSTPPADPRPVIAALDSLPEAERNAIPTVGRKKKRFAKGCGGCQVDVWMTAYGNTLPPDANNPPARPLKVAFVVNLGSYTTDMYGLRAGTSYDLIFRRNSTTGLGEFVFDPIGPGALVTGEVRMCEGHRPAPGPDANFRTCVEAAPAAPNTSSILGPALSKLLRLLDTTASQRDEDPAWWACGSGCCTARKVYVQN